MNIFGFRCWTGPRMESMVNISWADCKWKVKPIFACSSTSPEVSTISLPPPLNHLHQATPAIMSTFTILFLAALATMSLALPIKNMNPPTESENPSNVFILSETDIYANFEKCWYAEDMIGETFSNCYHGAITALSIGVPENERLEREMKLITYWEKLAEKTTNLVEHCFHAHHDDLIPACNKISFNRVDMSGSDYMDRQTLIFKKWTAIERAVYQAMEKNGKMTDEEAQVDNEANHENCAEFHEEMVAPIKPSKYAFPKEEL